MSYFRSMQEKVSKRLRRPKEKTRPENKIIPKEEHTTSPDKLKCKPETLPQPTSQPSDLWILAEQKMKQNPELAEVLLESMDILGSKYRLGLQYGDSSYHEQLCNLLDAKAAEAETKKWEIHLGDHSVVVRDQLNKVFKNILAVKEVVSTAASASPPASIACAGVMVCFTMVIQAVEQHAVLLRGLDLISESMIRLRAREDLYLTPQTGQETDLLKQLQEFLTSLCCKILEFQARALCYLHRRSAAQFLRNFLDSDGWASLCQDIERHEKSIETTTSLIEARGIRQKHQDLLERVEVIRNAAHQRDLWATTSARDERIRKFLKLLYTCPYKDRKNRNDRRVPGTCEWFTTHGTFQRWQQSSPNDLAGLLWVSADPGCGKSVLTRYLVDGLLLNGNERTVCYFFFKDDFADQKSATGALAAILRQLFIAKPQLLQDRDLDKMETDGEELVQSWSELWNMLISAASRLTAGEIICILDALDECQDHAQLIKEVREFYSGAHQQSKLKFLMTSRPYDHIRRGFSKLEAELRTIHLSGDGEEEVEQISREINLVIGKRVSDISKQRSLEEAERSMLERQLTAVENRTYLWVSLTMDVLENMSEFTKGEVRRVVQNLPETVESAYERILDRSVDKPKAKVLLQLITAAVEPLSLEELSLAWAIQMHAHCEALPDLSDDIEPKERFRKTLRDLCGLFVVIIDEKVYLLHQTAKEFLVSRDSFALEKNESEVTKWKHALVPEESNRILASICIAWVSWMTGDRSSIDQGNFDKYSSRHWVTHYHQACVRDEDPLIKRAHSICDPNSVVYETWSDIARVVYRTPTGTSRLQIASFLGLTGVVKLLLATEQVDIDSLDSKSGGIALSLAAENGHEAVVKLLLATGQVDINFPIARYGWTALLWATRYGHEAVVKLLLATGQVDINFPDVRGRTALLWAAQCGHEAVVKLLLATGQVDINFPDVRGRTALLWAAQCGHEAVTKLLLATEKVDVNFKNRLGRTALSAAIIYGREAVVKLLLATGQVDINFPDVRGRTALLWAAQCGHEAVTKLLLATEKVDINSQDEDGRSPLHVAAERGHEAVVKLLLATEKVDINSQDKYGLSPLHFVADRGHEAVVKLLLATENVDADLRDRNGRTPLDLASMKGYDAVVELLQQHNSHSQAETVSSNF